MNRFNDRLQRERGYEPLDDEEIEQRMRDEEPIEEHVYGFTVDGARIIHTEKARTAIEAIALYRAWAIRNKLPIQPVVPFVPSGSPLGADLGVIDDPAEGPPSLTEWQRRLDWIIP